MADADANQIGPRGPIPTRTRRSGATATSRRPGSSGRPVSGRRSSAPSQEFQEDNLTDWAATLTYYGLLALFPALIALVSIVGLVADPESTTNTLTDIVNQGRARLGGQHLRGPDQAGDREPRRRPGSPSVTSTLIALWSASGYLGAFIRASNVIYETREGRPFWKLRPLQLAADTRHRHAARA